MRTLFVKLFFWFTLATVLSGGIFFLLAVNLRLMPMHLEREHRFQEQHRRFVGKALSLYGESAALLLEKGFPFPQSKSESDSRMKAYLFAADGNPLGPDTPVPLCSAVRRSVVFPSVPANSEECRDVVVVRVKGPSGRSYLAATVEPPFSLPPPPRGFRLPPNAWLNFAVTLLISGLVCYILAWRLTQPIRRLRSATRSLATGDLTARVQLAKERGGDELSDLGREFNGMAERLEKLVATHRRLLRDVSHELRSPLARLGVALGIARKIAAPSAEQALARIEQEADHLNQMIGELLELSRLEGGSGTIAFAGLDLTELVLEIVRDADFEAESLGRRVSCLPKPAILLRGNHELLRRALENVVRNGIHYTKEGSTVEVSLETSVAEVTVVVRDHGPGVPEAQLAEIFRPFYRVAEARDRTSGGTGIGLAISEETVTLHGGSITADNAADGGLEVKIRLPRC